MIDDNELALEHMSHMFKNFGIKSQCFNSAASFKEQVNFLKAESLDWLFIDLIMPGEDGVQLYEYLQQTHPELAKKAVLMSFYDWNRLQDLAEEHNIPNFLSKPILPEQLVSLVGGKGPKQRLQGEYTRIPDLSDKKILLVEDNPLNQQVASELLSLTGVKLIIAENGEQAVYQVEHGSANIDLILMDLQMPIMGGIEATQILRKNPRYQSIPIVAMTAHVFHEEIERCKEVGMAGHVAKPIIPETLYQKLAEIFAIDKFVDMSAKSLSDATTQVNEVDAQVSLESLQALPDTDVLLAIERLAGNKTLFRKLLCEYCETYNNAPEVIENLLETEPDIEERRRYVHTFKGLSATIGFAGLSNQLALIEDEVLKDQPLDASMLLHLKNVHREIWKKLIILCEHSAPAETREELTDEAWQQILEQLIGLLKEFDGRTVEVWNDYQAQIAKRLPRQQFDKVVKALDDFDFMEAEKILSEYQAAAEVEQ